MTTASLLLLLAGFSLATAQDIQPPVVRNTDPSTAVVKPDLTSRLVAKPSDTIDLGPVGNFEPVPFVVKLVNQGSRPIRIVRVSTSCGCTAVGKVPNTPITPGQEVAVEARFNGHGYTGPVIRTMDFWTDEPGLDKPLNTTVIVRAIVDEAFCFPQPTNLVLNAGPGCVDVKPFRLIPNKVPLRPKKCWIEWTSDPDFPIKPLQFPPPPPPPTPGPALPPPPSPPLSDAEQDRLAPTWLSYLKVEWTSAPNGEVTGTVTWAPAKDARLPNQVPIRPCRLIYEDESGKRDYFNLLIAGQSPRLSQPPR
jgi:hypothetical protein